ncbi:antibiotic biosynthesis monooxygenase [Robertmurraya massiliosenegalensis]|uniref:antibiotic biosynthesis monooxygenase family protein n=1 Tax=Robertmurraya TaxID=2837507 RepID=UPI0039A575B6
MIVITNTIKVKKGYGEELAKSFDHLKDINNVPGLIELNFLQTRLTEDDVEEVVVWSKWESQKAHNQWATSDLFKIAHAGIRSESIIESKLAFYSVLVEGYSDAVKKKVELS